MPNITLLGSSSAVRFQVLDYSPQPFAFTSFELSLRQLQMVENAIGDRFQVIGYSPLPSLPLSRGGRPSRVRFAPEGGAGRCARQLGLGPLVC